MIKSLVYIFFVVVTLVTPPVSASFFYGKPGDAGCGSTSGIACVKSGPANNYVTAVPHVFDVVMNGNPAVWAKSSAIRIALGVRQSSVGTNRYTDSNKYIWLTAYHDLSKSAGGVKTMKWVNIDQTDPGYLAQGIAYYYPQLGSTITTGVGNVYCVGLFYDTGIGNPTGISGLVEGFGCKSDMGGSESKPPIEKCVATSTLNIDFGEVDRAGITNTGAYEKSAKLSINCSGVSVLPVHTFQAKLSGTGVTWAGGQLKTSNPALGVKFNIAGKDVNANSSPFDLGSTSGGVLNVTVKAALAKNPSVITRDIATGSFNANATLIIEEK